MNDSIIRHYIISDTDHSVKRPRKEHQLQVEQCQSTNDARNKDNGFKQNICQHFHYAKKARGGTDPRILNAGMKWR